MMKSSLRAFLMMRSDKGNWITKIFRDLTPVIRVWKEWEDLGKGAAVLHVGFDCPSCDIFDTVVSAYPGSMLLTEAAKCALPNSFVVSATSVALAEHTKVFIGLQGWGYSIEDPTTQATGTKISRQEQHDWINSFLKENHSDAETFSAYGIYDDASYLLEESKLEWSLRHHSGTFRTYYLAGAGCEDPCRFARYSPPWLVRRNLIDLPLTVRARRVFRTNDIKTVRDLSNWSGEALLSLRNFGRKSLKDTLRALDAALENGPLDTSTALEINRTNRQLPQLQSEFSSNKLGLFPLIRKPLLSELRSLLPSPNREQDILIRRLGFERPAETLQQIADDLGLTRERVRQIEKHAIRKWVRELHLNLIIEQKIKQLLTGRSLPLPITETETADPWFEGVSSHQEFFKNLIRAICRDSIHLIDIDNMLYFSLMDKETWNRTVSDAAKLLSSGSEQRWSEDSARSQVQNLLPDNAKEFGPALWDKLSPLCHFVTGEDNSRILIDYGRGAEQLVKTILAESDKPLHYTEIAERITPGKEKHITKKYVHHAAMKVGLLFGRGKYGLARHLPFTEEQMSEIRAEAEDIISSQNSGRQWHTSEILPDVLEGLDGEFGGLDKYVLDIALLRSRVLKPLGRMAWVAVDDNADDQARIDIRRTIIEIVKEAGRPLSTDEIRKRLTAVRGVGEFFHIYPTGPLIRLRPGVWGINDRDMPLSHKEQRELIDKLVIELNAKQSGIHISELCSVLPLQNCPPGAFFSVAVRDKRLKTSQGRYVYLTEWNGPRRETVGYAVSAVLRGATGPIDLEEIAVTVERRVGRKINKYHLYATLRALEAKFDHSAKGWNLNRPAVEDEKNDDPI